MCLIYNRAVAVMKGYNFKRHKVTAKHSNCKKS